MKPVNKTCGVYLPCTCGELFQGSLDGETCLVSCPINLYSQATTAYNQSENLPPEMRKTRQALHLLAERTGQKTEIKLHNPLPSGRGYGTSTADIGAALFCTSRMLHLDLSAMDAANIAVQVEPTDSTLFNGLTLFDHRTGCFQEFLGEAPPAWLLILDPGGVVDSGDFNAHDWKEVLRRLAPHHRLAFQLLQEGITNADLFAIGEAASLSARCHQAILFNPLVDLALSLRKKLGAAGICRAHSGTIVGLIFPEEIDREAACAEISRYLAHPIQIRTANLIGGGPGDANQAFA